MELKLKEQEEQKAREDRINEKKRIEQENLRIKEWEKKFDEEQKLKEEALLRKFEDKENNKIQKFKNDESSNDDTH